MKKINKIVGFILTLALVFNLSVVGFNCSEVEAASNVAYVWAVANCEGNGHGFLVVKNVSSSAITVGKMSVGAGKIVTLGTFGNLSDGKCLYYNVEKYRIVNGYWDYSPNTYIGEYITSSELSTLNSTIKNNTSWTLNKNCTSFVEACWNSFSDRDIFAQIYVNGLTSITEPVGLPSILALNMQKYSYGSDLIVSGSCSKSEIKYQSSSSASLKTASANTVSVLTSSSTGSSSGS